MNNTVMKLWRNCLLMCMAPVKKGMKKIFFLFIKENICYRYSLEAPWQGASNEYPQHMFSLRIRKTSTV